MRIYRLVLAIGLALFSLPGTALPTGAQDDVWLRYHNPAGISVRYPLGWQVQSSEGLMIVANADQTSFVMVYIFPAAAGYTAAQCLDDLLVSFGDALPQATVIDSQQLSTQPDERVSNLLYQTGTGAGFASAVCQVDQGQGLLALGATPQSRYDATWPTLSRIVDSIVVTESTPAAAVYDAQITYTTWTDPLEGAFSLDVPQDWRITGGMFDFYGTKRPSVSITNNDETVGIGLGPGDLIWFVVPTPTLDQQGYPSGAAIYMEGKYGILVYDYMSGEQAARFLAESYVTQMCVNFEITASRELPQQSGYSADGTSYVSAGEMAFTCTYYNKPITGYYYVTTLATSHPTLGQVWMIDTVLNYMAVPERTNEAAAILLHAYQSFALNPEWVSAQQAAATASTGAYTVEVPTGEYDPATLQILSDISAMQHETSLIIIDNIDGVTDYEYTYDYDYDYGW